MSTTSNARPCSSKDAAAVFVELAVRQPRPLQAYIIVDVGNAVPAALCRILNNANTLSPLRGACLDRVTFGNQKNVVDEPLNSGFQRPSEITLSAVILVLFFFGWIKVCQ